MALSTFTNGSSSGNIIQASWFNQYHDLLTGVMTDQAVTITNTLTASSLSSSYTMSGANQLVLKANATDVSEHDFGLIHETGAGLGIYDYSGSAWIIHFGRSIVSIPGALTVTGNLTSGQITAPNAVFSNNSITSWAKASGSVNAAIYTDTSSQFILQASEANKILFNSKTGVTALTIDTSGDTITLPNSYLLQFAPTTGTNGSMYVNSSNDMYIHAANNNKIIFSDKTSVALLTLDATANLITAAKPLSVQQLNLASGTITRISTFQGVGAGTWNHGLGATPLDSWAHPNAGVNGYIMSYSPTSTQVTIVVSSSGLNFACTCWA